MKSAKQEEWVIELTERVQQELKKDARQKEKDFAQLKSFIEKKNAIRK